MTAPDWLLSGTGQKFPLLCLLRTARPVVLKAAALWIVVAAIGASAAMGGIVGDVEALNLAATEWQANFERIATWRGRVVITGRSTYKDRPEIRTSYAAEFLCDRNANATRWKWSCERDAKVVGGKEVPRFEPAFSCGMIKNQAFYSLDEVRKSQQKRGQYVATIFPLEKARAGFTSSDFDPTFFLTRNGQKLSDWFLFFYRKPDSHGFFGASVKREGERVILENRREGHSLVNRYEADLSQGGNLVVYDTVSDTGSTRRRFRYEQVASVWVPKEVTYENVKKQQGRTTFRKLSWVENIVNEPCAEDEFSLAKLGLRRGDRVHDSRSNVDFIVHGTDFPPADDAEAAEGTNDD